MKNPRDVLNKLKWHNKYNLKNAEIWYIHRGAPHNTKIISGEDIIKLGKSFIETTSNMIPYHRVFRIVYNDKIIFERKK